MTTRTFLAAVLAALGLTVSLAFAAGLWTSDPVSSFDECAAAGYPVMESYPARCSDGERTFTQEVEQVSASGNVRVTSPLAGSEISSPATISGTARAFENTVNWRVRDGADNLLAEGYATADAPDVGQFGVFSAPASYAKPATPDGTVEVFTLSAQDGSVQDLVAVPVRFAEQEFQTVQAFFTSTSLDPGSLRCEVTHPVERQVAKTPQVARAALAELLRGPTQAEAKQGYATSIPAGTRIQRLEVADGVARVDFSAELAGAAGGSCRVSAVRSQIESTLRQFATVTRVEITVDGQENVLEP